MITDFSRTILMQLVNKTLLHPLNTNKTPLATSEMKCSSYLEAALKKSLHLRILITQSSRFHLNEFYLDKQNKITGGTGIIQATLQDCFHCETSFWGCKDFYFKITFRALSMYAIGESSSLLSFYFSAALYTVAKHITLKPPGLLTCFNLCTFNYQAGQGL